VATAAGAYALAGAVLSFIGWAAGIYRLTDWFGSGINIKTNTSIAIAAAGVALLLTLTRLPVKWLVRALGLLVALVGGLTLSEHLTGRDLGIDTLLYDEAPGAAATAAPNRMGPPAASSFVAIGIALYLLGGGARARAIGVGLGIAALIVSVVALTAHFYGASGPFAMPALGIATQTASMIAALCIGLVAAVPEHQPVRTLAENTTTGILARRLVPLVIAVPLMVGWLRVQGSRLDLYDGIVGAALRSVVEVALISALLWRTLQALRHQDLRRVRAEDELRDSERQLSDTLESITDGFVAFDREWRFAYMNSAAERLLRASRADVVGKVVWEVLPEARETPLYQDFQRAMAERVMVETDAADLAGRHFVNRVYPSVDGGVSVYFQDITLRRQAEEALRQADKRKDEFLATLAHELRNPLAPIRSSAKILLSKGLLDSQRQWAAEVINRQVNHMARLLDDLLDVSRISLNRLDLRKEWIDVATVLQSALETSRPLIDAAGHDIVIEPPPQPVYVDGDPVRLAQVFSNLLNNAAKYTERGGRIRLTTETRGGEAGVRVSDNGMGMSADTLQRLFGLFAQAEPALHRAQGGLGIGLWLSKAVVELHAGRIEARSAGLGQGSEFVVWLPRVIDVGGALPRAPDVGLKAEG
jgi:PAS domain S-box-containing protein